MAEQINNPQNNSAESGLLFPYENAKNRLNDYDYFESLFEGKHYEAFRIRIDSGAYNEAYNKLRYVKANFAGLLSKVVADMLFSEPVQIRVPGGDQEFVDALVQENHLNIQFYESALSNSYLGDALFKIRTGKRRPGALTEKPTVIIEDTTPNIYFPKVNGFNVRQKPDVEELAWTFEKGDKKYLRKEIHKPGIIENKVYEMEENKIVAEVGLDILGIPNLLPTVEVGIEDPLLFHVANWKTGRRYFGISDYYDLDTLFYAINNRMTKIDNILDKHSDPILAVPYGVLNKDGKVKREKMQMFEMPDGDTTKPEYIVWNASLENAFKEIEQIIEVFFMVSETSPDILGMGKGQSDSGRALKYKLLRTIAKVARKKLYYDATIKDLIYTAQKLAKYWGLEVGGKTLKGEPVRPEIIWSDGLPIDEGEQVDTEVKRIDAGLSTKKDSIMRIDKVDEDAAEEKAKEIDEETKIELPKMDLNANPFSKPKVPVKEGQ